jgi:2-polyprenyl-6-methoxyphenol hydroxylase-like FAD-dependent oxidoreductase
MEFPGSVAIIGGGPVGALAALYFAQKSKVTLFELRKGSDW